MSDNMLQIWVNGRLVAAEEAAILPIDHGITVGDGVFETAEVRDGVVFARTRHHDRMDRSLAGIGLAPLDRARLDEGIDAVLEASLAAHGEHPPLQRLRYTVTGGRGPLGSGRFEAEPTYIVALQPDPGMDGPATVAVGPWRRNLHSTITGLKTTSYAENAVMLLAGSRLGASETLFATSEGDLCEGTGSNTFVVTDGVLRTPGLDRGPLAGVTRGLVLEWAREAGMDVREEQVPMADLAAADEIFITSSIRGVQPVTRLVEITESPVTAAPGLAEPEAPSAQHGVSFDRELEVGPLTQRLAALFRENAAATPDP
ncbi:branched-chain amino acid aminotransferase [Kytococcus aerolatus]|uniref:Branched-chain amino acid aminotransferase n=1 Tax=Kytococcus aerolatus TaxID=592308 RepID=A0A212T2X7_9MICO|nr:aminotransferase class IV [Kytococcus aerolatus]SNC60393.1 branched-chain amino acid aminotransferase [Kytococcus aerolatus]